jgi:hypothetical protein
MLWLSRQWSFMQCTRTFGYDLRARYRLTAFVGAVGVTDEDPKALLDHCVETGPHLGRKSRNLP